MISHPRFLRVLIVLIFLGACRSTIPQACTGTDEDPIQKDTLTVAADYSYPPFAFRSASNDLVGYDVDVLRAIGEELDLDVRFVNRGTGALVAGALARRHDLAASGLVADDRLREETCPSAPYLDADLGVLTTDVSEVGDVDDLDGKTVAVRDGGRGAEWADENLKGSTIAAVPTTDDVLAAVKQGQADAAVDDLAVVRFAAHQSKGFRAAETIATDESYVFVTAPDNGGLMARVNEGLTGIQKSGKLSKIRAKWFG